MLTTVRAEAPSNAPLPGPAAALARDCLLRSLDVAELLVHDVLVPVAATAGPPDQVKEVAEVAMLLRMAHRLGDQPITARVETLAEAIAPLARSESIRRQLVGRVSAAAPKSLAHACLSSIGLTDDQFERVVTQALTSSAACAAERVPFRILDVAWIRHLILGDQELLDHPVLPLTCLGQGVDLVGANVDAAYALSHTLPYATDFGRLELPSWVDRAKQSQLADALIAKALAADDLDLLGELLMTAPLLRLPWSPMQVFGWTVLTEVWRDHPILPGPGIPRATGPEDELTRRRRVLGTVYHTPLVGGLLMATALWRRHLPPDDFTATTARESPPRGPALDATLKPAWRAVWARLSDGERQRSQIAPWLMALHQAVDALDAAGLLALLRQPQAAHAPTEPVRQAVELLQRLVQAGTPSE